MGWVLQEEGVVAGGDVAGDEDTRVLEITLLIWSEGKCVHVVCPQPLS